MDAPWPNLFLVGAPRCGTTSLFAYLGEHPEVFAPLEKEPHHYDGDLVGQRTIGREAYASLFSPAGDERWRVDATATYLYSETAPEAILRDSPDARVLIALRDPVEFVASWHALLLASGAEAIADLGEALAAEGDRRAGRRVPPHAVPRLLLYSELARFDEHVARWTAAFGEDRVHVTRLEDLHADPEGTCGALLRFLDLEPIPGAAFPHLNPARATRAPALLAPLNGGSHVRTAARALLPPPVRRALWRAVTRALTPATARPEVEAELRARVAEYVAVQPPGERQPPVAPL